MTFWQIIMLVYLAGFAGTLAVMLGSMILYRGKLQCWERGGLIDDVGACLLVSVGWFIFVPIAVSLAIHDGRQRR